MLDADLAELYGVETRTLVQAVKRNAFRFPSDFMFQLNASEFASLRSQFVISSWGWSTNRVSVPSLLTIFVAPRHLLHSIRLGSAADTKQRSAYRHATATKTL